VSGKGLKSLGFDTVTSTLHQEICQDDNKYLELMRIVTYPFEVNFRVLHLNPTWTHNFPLEDKQLKRAGIGTQNAYNVLTASIVGDDLL
jgi:hypothetical protein